MARSKKKAISVNFDGVESGGSVLPEDDYLVKVDEVELETSDSSGQDYLSFTFEVAEGDHTGKKLYHNCSLQPQALFNLRNVLESLGVDVPDGPMDLDPADLIDLTCSVAVQHEEYQGKTKARIVEFRGEESQEVAQPQKASPTRKKKKTATIEVGSTVTFTDDEGEDQVGKVTALDGDDVTVKVGKEEWELGLDELTLKA
jgi:hypothetical protein